MTPTSSNNRSVRPLFRALSMIFILALAHPISFAAPPQSSTATFQYSMNSSEPIIEYNLIHSLLADQGPEPLLRIYASGRVHAHFPTFMKGAGDYEMQLNQTELRELLQQLSDDGIIDFDSRAMRAERRQLMANKRASGQVLFHISDATHTVVDIRLDGYQRNASSPHISNMIKRFQWKNLEHDKKRFPGSEAIQRASTGAQRLHSLFSHQNMRKIR